MNNLTLISDETVFNGALTSARPLRLSELLERQVLRSPDNEKVLGITTRSHHQTLFDGVNTYAIREGCPILYPKAVTEHWDNGALGLKHYNNPLLQYVLLSQIKQSGEINAQLESLPARKHQWRFKQFCAHLKGLVLDVGSDKPSHSVQLLPDSCEYIGLDPYSGSGEFRLIAMGEMLPLCDLSVDVIIFNTSLDHILDYHTAICEAHRVLKKHGTLVIATYAWLYNATLLTDSVHFHHFRENEILSSVEELFIREQLKRYEDPKHEDHRYGLYAAFRKK